MADISVAPKPRGQYTWIWAILAIVAIAALMLWLAEQSEQVEQTANMQTDSATVAEGEGSAGQAVDLPTVAAAPDSFMAGPLSISGVSVAATLGPRAFWADVPGANPFLVVLAPEVPNAEAIAVGQTVNLQGTVNAVSEELVTEWVQSGAVNEGAREEATFATHFLLADQVNQ